MAEEKSKSLLFSHDKGFKVDEGYDHTRKALSTALKNFELQDPQTAGSYESQVHKNIVGAAADMSSRLPVQYADPSDAYANSRKIVLSFYSLIHGVNIQFKAFVTNFADNYSSDWAEEMVFGRNDPIYSFKSTKRNISLSFELVAATRIEAVTNLQRLQNLIKALYPAYKNPSGKIASLIKSPLIKMKFANLISDHSTAGGASFDSYKGGTPKAKTGGLLGVIKSLAVTPNFDAGVYDGPGPATVYPKLIEVSLDFGVIHQSTLGFTESNAWNSKAGSSFPYGAAAKAYLTTVGKGAISDMSELRAWTSAAQSATAAYRMTEGSLEDWTAPAGSEPCGEGEGYKWSEGKCVDAEELEDREAQEAEIAAVKEEIKSFLHGVGKEDMVGAYMLSDDPAE